MEFPTLARTGVALAPEEGDAGRGDAPALRGHDPGQEKLILTHSLPYGPTDLKNLAESLACPADPRVLAGVLYGGGNGSCSPPWPGRRGPSFGK